MKVKVVRCKKCESPNVVRAGKINDNQRYKCKNCGCQFQPNRKSGKPEGAKRLAQMLYMFGLSQRTIAKIVKSDVHAVHRWIKKFAQEHYEKPEPVLGKVIIELDEMWHFLQKNKTNSGYGRLIAAIPVNLSTGSAEGEIMLHFQGFTNG
jgi:transposase-like protein